MVNIIRSVLCLGQSCGSILFNKGTNHGNFVYLMVLMTLWLTTYSLVVNKRNSRLTALFIILMVLILMCLKTKSLLLFYVYFEARILPITLILYLYGYQPEKLQASLFLLLYTVARRLPLLLVILLGVPDITSYSFLALPITLAFIVKSPIYLLHTWLPKAHLEAPVGGSMLLAGVLLKLGRYGLLIFLPSVKMNSLLALYLSLSVIGSVVCSLICRRQGDMKLLIAYSSVVHIGVVSLGYLSGTEMGYTCRLMMVFAHGLCSPFLFSFSFSLYLNSHSRLLLNNAGTWPLPMALLLSLVSINIGLPPRLGLWSEVFMVIRLVSFVNWAWFLILLVFFFGVAYNLILYTLTMHAKFSLYHHHMESSHILPIVQVIFYAYTSFFCLDLFHFS